MKSTDPMEQLRADTAARIAAHDQDATCFEGVPCISEILERGRTLERERVMAFMLSCYESSAAANGATISCHSVQAMDRWQTMRQQFNISDALMIQRLRRFASGEVPLWRI